MTSPQLFSMLWNKKQLLDCFDSKLSLAQPWFEKIILTLNFPFIQWCDTVGKQDYTSGDTDTAQWHEGLVRCCVSSLPCRGLSSPASKSILWSPFLHLCTAKGQKKSSLKYLVTWGQHITSSSGWPSGQIRSQAGVHWRVFSSPSSQP